MGHRSLCISNANYLSRASPLSETTDLARLLLPSAASFRPMSQLFVYYYYYHYYCEL